MIVSVHACERFAQRVLNIKDELSLEQKLNIAKMVLRVIRECCPEAFYLTVGTFIASEYECKFIICENSVVTVSEIKHKAPSDLSGGIRRSGKKIKKQLERMRDEHKRNAELAKRTRMVKQDMETK